MADPSTETKVDQETKPAAAPVFGAAFGTGGGFGGLTGAFSGFGAASAPKADAEEGGDEEEGAAVEEECQAEFKPLVQLEEVETKSGEEDEDCLCDLKCKLYRYDNASNEWKERGIGQAKLLQHKENKKVRLLMRQEKTLKIRANHIVMPGTKLQEHSGNDKAWVWTAVDFAEEQQKVEMFCIRFGSVERTQEFKKKFEEAMAINADLITMPATTGEDEEAEAAGELAEQLQGTKVDA